MSSSDNTNFENPFHDRPGSKDYTAFEERMKRLQERQDAQIPSTDSGIITGGDGALDEARYRRDFDGTKKGRDAIFLFPESYNLLRQEIHDYWPELWAVVSWRMAFRAEEFIECMNEALEMRVLFDTDKVDWISKQYLGKLQELRRNRAANLVLLSDVTGKETP